MQQPCSHPTYPAHISLQTPIYFCLSICLCELHHTLASFFHLPLKTTWLNTSTVSLQVIWDLELRKGKMLNGWKKQINECMDDWIYWSHYLPSTVLVPATMEVSRGKFPASTLLLVISKTNISPFVISAQKISKVKWENWGWWTAGAVPDWLSRKGFYEGLPFGQKAKWKGGTRHAEIWRKSFLGVGKSKLKGPMVRMFSACLTVVKRSLQFEQKEWGRIWDESVWELRS